MFQFVTKPHVAARRLWKHIVDVHAREVIAGLSQALAIQENVNTITLPEIGPAVWVAVGMPVTRHPPAQIPTSGATA
jgi:hypothetical protein